MCLWHSAHNQATSSRPTVPLCECGCLGSHFATRSAWHAAHSTSMASDPSASLKLSLSLSHNNSHSLWDNYECIWFVITTNDIYDMIWCIPSLYTVYFILCIQVHGFYCEARRDGDSLENFWHTMCPCAISFLLKLNHKAQATGAASLGYFWSRLHIDEVHRSGFSSCRKHVPQCVFGTHVRSMKV